MTVYNRLLIKIKFVEKPFDPLTAEQSMGLMKINPKIKEKEKYGLPPSRL